MCRIFVFAVCLLAIDHSFAGENLPQNIEHELAGKLCLIPAGEFMMGSPKTDPNGHQWEYPQHRVKIDQPFYMGVHEVTVEEFRRFVGNTSYISEAEKDGVGGWGYSSESRAFERPAGKYSWRNTGWPQTGRHPVVNVTWRDSVAYCDWLTEMDSTFRFRLPNEAEWEYACRAGTDTSWNVGDEARKLQDSDNINDRSIRQIFASTTREFQYSEEWNDGFEFTNPVGAYKANAFGLFDMHGNVSEWCRDVFDEDRYVKPDAVPAIIGEYRVFRGGNWIYHAAHSRSAKRHRFPPEERWANLGFRVVRETVPKAESLEQSLALVPLYRFNHQDLQQHYYAYGAKEVDNLRKRREISGETLLGYVSIKEEPQTVRLWRYEMPNRKQYFLHFVKGPRDPQIGSDLRAWLDRGGQPVPHYSVWVWRGRHDKRLVPVYATSMPDGTDMLFSRDRQEIKAAIRDTWNSRGIKRSDLGIAFYVFPELVADIGD